MKSLLTSIANVGLVVVFSVMLILAYDPADVFARKKGKPVSHRNVVTCTDTVHTLPFYRVR